MPVASVEEVPVEEYTGKGASNVKIQRLISDAPTFTMRRFIVGKAGYTPLHSHDYEHEVFILSGNGLFNEDGKESSLEPGSVVYVKPNVKHQFRNKSADPLVFLCLVPK